MVDVAFSLWRSAFLTNVARDRTKIYLHMKEFLQKVVETNAITFADDYKLCELTVGYYNNNARYRIERMYEHNAVLLTIPEVQKVADLRKAKDLAAEKQSVLWDTYYSALMACFRHFKRNWDERPAAKAAVHRRWFRRFSSPEAVEGYRRRRFQSAAASSSFRPVTYATISPSWAVHSIFTVPEA
jgi:hypothetical protein